MKINEFKKKFLDKFNFNRCKTVALTMAVNAALQHNKLYKSSTHSKERKKIRNFLKAEIISISQKYNFPKSQHDFKNDLEDLKFKMNNEFSSFFEEQFKNGGLEPGFRISHSQKCLSVYLKHLWCMNKIPIPPIPPIDRNILKNANYKNLRPTWTAVNSIAQYNFQLSYLLKAANGVHVTEWELIIFDKLEYLGLKNIQKRNKNQQSNPDRK
jgi:hypothetical protein